MRHYDIKLLNFFLTRDEDTDSEPKGRRRGGYWDDAGGSLVATDMAAATTIAINTGGDVRIAGSATAGAGIISASGGSFAAANLNVAGGNILLDATGAINVDHAEASGNFQATTLSDFTTGPNSIITVGDIVINSGNIADLGNSTARGFIDITASQIDFVTLLADQSITLATQITPNTFSGNGNIAGTDMTAINGAISTTTNVGSTAISGIANAATTLTVASSGSSLVNSAISGGAVKVCVIRSVVAVVENRCANAAASL